jgi:hypothetical protein
MRPKDYVRTALSLGLGAGAVVGGAYVFSRIREKQETETRLERLEQIVEQLSKEK